MTAISILLPNQDFVTDIYYFNGSLKKNGSSMYNTLKWFESCFVLYLEFWYSLCLIDNMYVILTHPHFFFFYGYHCGTACEHLKKVSKQKFNLCIITNVALEPSLGAIIMIVALVK